MLSALAIDLRALVRVYRGGELRTEPLQAAAAVVLGAEVLPGGWPSRTLRVRALFAAQLHSKGLIKVVIPSGGVGNYPPSEAAVISWVLRTAGVPDESIVPEEQGRSTRDSARRVTELARARGIENV